MWWISLIMWIAVGQLSFFWLPPTHHSWTGAKRVALFAVFAVMVGYLGPFGLWATIRSAKLDS